MGKKQKHIFEKQHFLKKEIFEIEIQPYIS